MSNPDAQKRAAGEAAAALVASGMVVGLGTGSTAALVSTKLPMWASSPISLPGLSRA